jgi:hypothetical protein
MLEKLKYLLIGAGATAAYIVAWVIIIEWIKS